MGDGGAGRRVRLALRGALPLLGVALAAIGGPALLAWAIGGGPFGWPHLLIGLGAAALLLLAGGLILGWALGRRLRGG